MTLTRKSTIRCAFFIVIGTCVSVVNAQIGYIYTFRAVSAEAENLCEVDRAFDHTSLVGDYSFSATAVANAAIGCDYMAESFVEHCSIFTSNIISGATLADAQVGDYFGVATTASLMEARFIVSVETPFVMSGFATPNAYVELSRAGTILAEVGFDSSTITGVLPAGVYSLKADAQITLMEPAAGLAYYDFTFETVPEPRPACLLMLGFLPLVHSAWRSNSEAN